MVQIKKRDLRFLAAMAVFASVVFLIYREEVVGPPLAPLATLTAQITVWLLHWVGIDAVREATLISQPGGFAYNISFRCTAILPMTFLTAAILFFPVPMRKRIVGLMIGLPMLMLLNVTRLIHLFYIGLHDPAHFELWHEDLWRGMIRLAILVIWMAWALWAERGTERGLVKELRRAEAEMI